MQKFGYFKISEHLSSAFSFILTKIHTGFASHHKDSPSQLQRIYNNRMLSTATIIPAGLTLTPTETKLENQFVKNENGKVVIKPLHDLSCLRVKFQRK